MTTRQQRTTPTVAIIGAGISGLAAAHTLSDAGANVTIYEKSHAVGGRAVTRRRNGYVYDYGAQYFKEGSPEIMAFITERFRTPDLFDITKPVWTFTGQNEIQEGDPQQNTERKISYHDGLSALSKQMAKGLHIAFETFIDRIEHHDTWDLFDTSGHVYGSFDAVIVSIPVPQASSLICNSPLHDTPLQSQAVELLETGSYNPLISVMLGYASCPRLRDYYALVNTDKQHAISWLAWEHEKGPERTPPGAGLLIAQMAPQYSQEHLNTPPAILYADVAQQVATLIDEDLPAPTFTDHHYWRFALPRDKADKEALNKIAIPRRIAFCGDGFVGGRLHLALEHGTIVAQQLIDAHFKT
ncbi:FAD-dependent oxidoreductase [Ktedonobacteria bacterium brp13]|nr:FAD-dependent oxidoreductase [Ktedonobacteria bacterium brp13]